MIAAPGSSASRTSVPARMPRSSARSSTSSECSVESVAESISARRGTGCALDQAERARGPAHRQALRGHRQHDDEEHGVEDARRPGTPAATGKVASTMGTPPRRPAQARKPCSRSVSPNGVAHTKHRQRAGDEHERDRRRGSGASPSSSTRDGVTSRPSSTNSPSCASQADALQEAAHDRRVRDARVADHEADEIGGEQARAVQAPRRRRRRPARWPP